MKLELIQEPSAFRHGECQKSSKKVFPDKSLPTALQFGIYALAMLNEFGALPVESEYRFLLIDKVQYALTKGWEKRLIAALDKVLDSIDACEKKNVFIPKPSPLCYWCAFCKNNPEAGAYQNECEYFSLWEPNNKSFSVNKAYNALEQKGTVEQKGAVEMKRKLVF